MKAGFYVLTVALVWCCFPVCAQNPALAWAKALHGAETEVAQCIVTDPSGNVYISGVFTAATDFDPGTDVYELIPSNPEEGFIVKLDAAGNFLWAIRMGASVNGLAIEASGALTVSGQYNEGELYDFDPGPAITLLPAHGGKDIFVAHISSAGGLIWAVAVGDSGDDYVNGLTTDHTGAIYLAGHNEGAGHVFITRFNISGTQQWTSIIDYANVYGGASISIRDIKAASGNVYFTGICGADDSNGVDFDPGPAKVDEIRGIYVCSFTDAGNFNWVKQFISSSRSSSVYSIGTDGSGNVYTAGIFYGTTDFDPGDDVYELTTLDPDDENYGASFISKLSPIGDFLWAKNFNAMPFEGLAELKILIATDGTVYGSGWFSGTVDFDPGLSETSLVADAYDGYLFKLDADGDFGWVVRFGAEGDDRVNQAAIDPFGNLLLAGSFESTVDFDPGATELNLTATSMDGFVLKISENAASPPVITSFTPSSGMIGEPVTITGLNFSTVPTENSVRFNGVLTTVSSATTTSILTVVPASASTGPVTVTVSGFTATSVDNFIVTVPVPIITNFNPASGPVNTLVTITGINFDSNAVNNVVRFNGTPSTVMASTSTSITTRVPQGAETGIISVTVGANTAGSAVPFVVTIVNQPPVIEGHAETVQAGQQVSIDLLGRITDPENELDTESFKIIQQPVSGALATIQSGILLIDYKNLSFAGTDQLTLEACDLSASCTQQQFNILVAGEIIVYNAISPNADGKNEFLRFENIEVMDDTKDNRVQIYNRWGDLVFETTNYNNTDNVFTGVSNRGEQLPSGTYFYKVTFKRSRPEINGYLSLRR